MKIKFKSLSSGSCGNCYWIGAYSEDGTLSSSLVVDTGVSLRRARKELAIDKIDVEAIDCILVTHDHMDHIRSLGSWCKRLAKPVWATPLLHDALTRHPMVHSWIASCRHTMEVEEWKDIVPGHIRALCFEVPHDASQTLGYAIEIEGYRIMIMTDAGRVTESALKYARESSTVIFESNYDPDMLQGGPYPEQLKHRIRSGSGHLSNPECAEAIRNFDHEGLTAVFLCHLSDHNNTPELALACSRDAASCRIAPLPRMTPSTLISLI